MEFFKKISLDSREFLFDFNEVFPSILINIFSFKKKCCLLKNLSESFFEHTLNTILLEKLN